MSNDGLFVTSVDRGVRNVHLLSGEDIIGHVSYFPNEKVFRIETPVMPTMSQDPQGNYRVGLLPLRPYLDKVSYVDVPEVSILYDVPVGDKMGKLYAQFTSNVIIAGPGSMPGGSLDAILNQK